MTCQLVPTFNQIQQAGQCLYKFDAVGSYPSYITTKELEKSAWRLVVLVEWIIHCTFLPKTGVGFLFGTKSEMFVSYVE